MDKNDFKTVIDFAILEEVEAYEFYLNAEKKVKDDSLKGIFSELAKEELEHKGFLEDILEKNMVHIELDANKDYKISETIDKPKLSVDMKFSDAIGLAIKKEEEAMAMYKDLADACLDQELKDVFIGLEKMELTHKVKLEEIYLNVAYAEVW